MAPELSPDEIRQLLRECVTVVKPGETLILRCPEGWTPDQAGEMQEYAAWWLAENAPEVKVLVVPHLDMAVVQPETDAEFTVRLGRVLPQLLDRERRRSAANWAPGSRPR